MSIYTDVLRQHNSWRRRSQARSRCPPALSNHVPTQPCPTEERVASLCERLPDPIKFIKLAPSTAARSRDTDATQETIRNMKARAWHSQSSQVRWAFWQWKHARFAFFFFGPSRVRVGCDEDSALSLAVSLVRLRLHGGFFLGSREAVAGAAVIEAGAPENSCGPAT